MRTRRADALRLEAGGSNALDFHIAFYLGVLAAADPTGVFHIISKDTGFDPLLQHLKARGVSVFRLVSIEAMSCFGQGAASTVDSKVVSGEGKLKSSAKRVSVDDLIKIAVDDLIKRNTARPRTPKTLRSTIHARCGKERPAADIDAVYEALVKRGYIKVDGTKLTYALPTAREVSASE